jgi:cytochrome c553
VKKQAMAKQAVEKQAMKTQAVARVAVVWGRSARWAATRWAWAALGLAAAGLATAAAASVPTPAAPRPLAEPAAARVPQASLDSQVRACTVCHGRQGQASSHGYLPRIAGKPAGYLYNQLTSFRDGGRHYPLMRHLLENLTDDYLREIAGHFSALELPYPPPQVAGAPATELTKGRTLVMHGDPARGLPACASCHGDALTGVMPATPGLLGLPRDYLNAQLGAWKTSQRRAAAPDCMADIAARLEPQDIAAVSTWLASQPLPANPRATAPPTRKPPVACGSVPAGSPNRVATAGTATAGATPMSAAPGTPFTPPALRRGEYLARAGNCAGCHTVPGGRPFAGGRPIDTPFGIVHSSNLTPDPATGIGQWSADDFWLAMHEGRSRGGRLLYPAFPYPNYTRISREDSDAILAYLRSQPAVQRSNQAHDLRFPFNTQWALAAWRMLFFEPGARAPDPARSAQWNRGAYLVQGLGHCDACHAPRNPLGATRGADELRGGPVPGSLWHAPSLGAPQDLAANRHRDDLVRLLRTGQSGGAAVQGPMAEVVYRSTQYLDDADLAAVAAYLQTLPRQDRPATVVRDPEVPSGRGPTLYRQHCADCHGDRGEGVTGAYPALAGNRRVTAASPQNLIAVVLAGGFAPATAANPRPHGMPPFSHLLDDDAVAAVVSHIRGAWGNAASPVGMTQVRNLRQGR